MVGHSMRIHWPIGDVEQTLNSAYKSGALKTYGLDLGYFIKPEVHASVGYYYQNNDEEHVDGSVVRARVSYEFSDGLTAGLNVAHDLQDSDQFDTRVSADLTRFNAPSKGDAESPSNSVTRFDVS